MPKISLRRGGASSFDVSMGGGGLIVVVLNRASSTDLFMSSWLLSEPLRNALTLVPAANKISVMTKVERFIVFDLDSS